MDYICSKILYPNILEFGSYRREVLSFPANGQKVKEVDSVLNEIKEYADLTYADVEKYAGELARLFRQEDFCPDNFCLQEMKNVLRGVEDFRTDRQIKMAESVIRDMRKTLNSEPLFSNQSFVSSERSKLEWKGKFGLL